MKEIMVILTGGTIGSQIADESHQIVRGEKDIAGQLLSDWMDTEAFSVYQPVNLLSENETPEIWRQVSEFIHRQYEKKAWDAVLITHGSDTLPYFAAAMGIMCGDMPVPVVITAANYSLEDSRSNGYENVRGCMEYILSSPEAGTVVVYQNPGEKTKIYDAFQLKEADHEKDCFSAYGDCYGSICDGEVTVCAKLKSRLDRQRENYEMIRKMFLNKKGLSDGRKDDGDRNGGRSGGRNVLCLRPVPGLDYDSFVIDETKIGALLHDTYHSGTACTAGKEENLLCFLETLQKKNIPLFLTGLKSNVDNQYETTVKLIEQGACVLWDSTFETSYVLLVLAVNSYLALT